MAPNLRQTAAKVAVMDEDSMDVDEPQVRLKTSDGKRFILSKSEASCFNALHMMIEGCQNQPSASGEYVNLHSVHSELLTKVIEWCREHCDVCQLALESQPDAATCKRDPKVELTDGRKRFLGSMKEEELFELLHVTNFLDVRCLFNACCQTIGKRWEGMKVEEIRKLYGIESDFSTEEENQMLQDSKRFGFTD